MDRETRNAIQRATQSARAVLEREVAQQLEGIYDIRIDGTIPSEPGAHLDQAQRLTREKLVAAVTHHAASGRTRAEAVGDYLRESAFTTLNRFVALKMLEARELVQECVSRGDQSSGFREFCGLAPGLVQLPDQGYRLYLESLFDEIGQEVGILFDRRDPSSLIWPRRQALNELLEILNDRELARVWGDDETIGWVYQYFNSSDERRQMRDESRRRATAASSQSETSSSRRGTSSGSSSTTHLHAAGGRCVAAIRGSRRSASSSCLTTPTNWTRQKKDPRDIRILDPACGSGHFLLYAFDLLQTIYEEAWHDDASPSSPQTGSTLKQDYRGLGELRRALPAMILAQQPLRRRDRSARGANRCVGALAPRAARLSGVPDRQPRSDHASHERTSLWPSRCQATKRSSRRSPSDLQPPLLGDLFRRMVFEMRLAGELGTLLRVDDAIATPSRRRERSTFDRRRRGTSPACEPERRQEELDFSEIDDVRFFEEAEAILLERTSPLL